MTDSLKCAPEEYAITVTITAATIRDTEACVATAVATTPAVMVAAGAVQKITQPRQGLFPVWQQELDLGCVKTDTPIEFSLINGNNNNAACMYFSMHHWNKGRRGVDGSDVGGAARTARTQDFTYQITSTQGSVLAVALNARPAPVLVQSTWDDTTPGDKAGIAIGVLVFLAFVAGFFYMVRRASLSAMGASSGGNKGEDSAAMLGKTVTRSDSKTGARKGADAEGKDDYSAAL